VSREPVPIVCTLAPEALPDRVDRWRTLVEVVTARSPIPNGVRLAFGDGASVAEIAQLALAEHACCTFFTFTIAVDADTVTLEVVAPPEARDLLTQLVGPPR
jgi:hypothetical protein